MARRMWLLPAIVPLLIIVGWGTGRVVANALDLQSPVVKSDSELVRLAALQAGMENTRRAADIVTDYLLMYRDQVAPVEQVLVQRGVAPDTARKVAWPLVAYAKRWNVDPSLALAIMLIESGGYPGATSSVGARGLMQVMPSWQGVWRECGDNLYGIDDNICYGVAILAYYKRRHPDQHRALLAYNGCVRGTNTPNCFSYPDHVLSLRQQILREWAAAPSLSLGAAASP